jgi:hypothetical protein
MTSRAAIEPRALPAMASNSAGEPLAPSLSRWPVLASAPISVRSRPDRRGDRGRCASVQLRAPSGVRRARANLLLQLHRALLHLPAQLSDPRRRQQKDHQQEADHHPQALQRRLALRTFLVAARSAVVPIGSAAHGSHAGITLARHHGLTRTQKYDICRMASGARVRHTSSCGKLQS